MDFFARQEEARRRTVLLVLLLFPALAGIGLAVYTGAVLLLTLHRHFGQASQGFPFWNPAMFAAVMLAVTALVGGGSLWKVRRLASGGGWLVAQMVGAEPLCLDTRDAAEKRLLNVVEEMAIASGVDVPILFVLREVAGVNAFVAGSGSEDAVLVVTRGCLEQLGRDELQAVVAHEFSHLLNGDMRFNLRLTGLVHGILLLALIGRQVLQARVRNGRLLLYSKIGGLLLIAAGHAGVLAARMIKFAITRQREFLADAAAVQFTRHPEALVRVLLRLQSDPASAVVKSPQAEAVSHMFFARGVSNGCSGLFATHPPISERIRRIDPRLNAAKLARLRDEIADSREKAADAARGNSPAAQGGDVAATGTASLPDFDRLRFAQRFLESLTPALSHAAHDPVGAEALLYGLLLSSEAPSRQTQIAALRTQTTAEVQHRLRAIIGDLNAAGRDCRLPLAELAGAAIRRLPPEERERIAGTVRTLAEADGRIGFFEYAVQRVFLKRVARGGGQAKSRRIRHRSIDTLTIEAVEILSMICWQAYPQPLRAAEAFRKAAGVIDPGGGPLAILPREKIGLKRFDRALESFAEAALAVKRRLLDAAGVGLHADGRSTMGRIALERMLAAALDLPAPAPPPLPAAGVSPRDSGRDRPGLGIDRGMAPAPGARPIVNSTPDGMAGESTWPKPTK